MTTLYLDIETLPVDWSDEQIDAHALASVPGNYTKPDSIAKWVEEHRLEQWSRTALDWRYARICAIGLKLFKGVVDAEDTMLSVNDCSRTIYSK